MSNKKNSFFEFSKNQMKSLENNKKGSMELGVNAIVVLIIALVILGLAIAFVTNLFRSGQDNLEGIVDNTKLSVHASASEPIKFEKQQLTVKQGRTTTLVISVFNDGFATAGVPVNIILDPASGCQDSLGQPPLDVIDFRTPSQPITPGTDVGYKGILSTGPNVDAGTYICTFKTSGGSTDISSQVIVEVTL